MEVTVVRETCIGCAVCVAICPDLFELDEDSIAIVKINPIPADLGSAVREAAESCAVDAIHIEE